MHYANLVNELFSVIFDMFFSRLNYKGDVKTTTPTLVTGDGDGTVNIRSLKSCESWAGKQGGKTVHSIEVPNADHMGILSDKRVIQYVLTLLTDDSHYDKHKSEQFDLQVLRQQHGH